MPSDECDPSCTRACPQLPDSQAARRAIHGRSADSELTNATLCFLAAIHLAARTDPSIAFAFGGLPQDAFSAAMTPSIESDYRPNAWVTMAIDGTVTIMSPAAEMGQGIVTTLPLLISEDMDADWDKVHIVQTPSDAKAYAAILSCRSGRSRRSTPEIWRRSSFAFCGQGRLSEPLKATIRGWPTEPPSNCRRIMLHSLAHRGDLKHGGRKLLVGALR